MSIMDIEIKILLAGKDIMVLHHHHHHHHHPSSIIHHPSSIIHHPSSIIHHPSSIIHHHYSALLSCSSFSIIHHQSSSLLIICNHPILNLRYFLSSLFHFESSYFHHQCIIIWVVPLPRIPVANEGLGWDPRS